MRASVADDLFNYLAKLSTSSAELERDCRSCLVCCHVNVLKIFNPLKWNARANLDIWRERESERVVCVRCNGKVIELHKFHKKNSFFMACVQFRWWCVATGQHEKAVYRIKAATTGRGWEIEICSRSFRLMEFMVRCSRFCFCPIHSANATENMRVVGAHRFSTFYRSLSSLFFTFFVILSVSFFFAARNFGRFSVAD